MVDGLARPEPHQQLQPFVQPFGEHTSIGGVAEAAVLVLDRPAQPGGEDDPASTEVVQGGHLPRELLRPITSYRREQRPHPDT